MQNRATLFAATLTQTDWHDASSTLTTNAAIAIKASAGAARDGILNCACACHFPSWCIASKVNVITHGHEIDSYKPALKAP
jgi:hypothetical protein